MTMYLKTMYIVIFTINISKQLTQLVTDPKPLRDDLKQPVLKEGLTVQPRLAELKLPFLS